MQHNIPNIALVGNAPKESHDFLNNILADDDLADICHISLYGADGSDEKDALNEALQDHTDGEIDCIICLPMNFSVQKVVRNYIADDSKWISTIQANNAAKLSFIKEDYHTTEEGEKKIANSVIEQIKILQTALKRDFSILNPRIAILSFDEKINTEGDSKDINFIAPLVSELVGNKVQAFGPCKRERFFADENYRAYDLIIEINEKKCLNDFILSSNEPTTSVISNINIPVALMNAPEDLLNAIYTVIDVMRNRKAYDNACHNPLQKLYHERKEDGDKARFAIKKKGFNPAEHRRENITFSTTKSASTSTSN